MTVVMRPVKTAKERICPSQRNLAKHEKQSHNLMLPKSDLIPQNFTLTDLVDVKIKLVSNNPAGHMLQVWGNSLSTNPLPLSLGGMNLQAVQSGQESLTKVQEQIRPEVKIEL